MRHCLSCEVSWALRSGARCWCCGRPSTEGGLPVWLISQSEWEAELNRRKAKGAA